jgi:hypothetical protein
MDKYLKAVYIAIGISFVTITICFFYPSFEVVNVIADFGIFLSIFLFNLHRFRVATRKTVFNYMFMIASGILLILWLVLLLLGYIKI